MLELVPVTPTISMIQAPNKGRFPFANSLLIRDGGVTALLDTGIGPDALRALLTQHAVDFVICSHSHIDHISGNWLMAGHPIWLPAGIGFETAGSVQKLALRFQHDPAVQQAWLASSVQLVGYRDAPPTDAYPPGHVFTIGKTRLQAVAAPGHVLDHTCFWEPEHGLLFSTDIDFSRFGPWYGNPESDIDDFIESIQRVRTLGPRVVVSSHKGIYRDGEIDRAFEAYRVHFERRDGRILAALADPLSIDALVDRAIIYGRFPRAAVLLRYFERVMLEKHLHRLARQNRAEEIQPGVWRRIQGRG